MLLALNCRQQDLHFHDIYLFIHLGLNSTLKLVKLLTPSQPWSVTVLSSEDCDEAEHVEVD